MFDKLIADLAIDLTKWKMETNGNGVMTYTDVVVLTGDFGLSCKTLSYSFFENGGISAYRRRKPNGDYSLHVSLASEMRLKRSETQSANTLRKLLYYRYLRGTAKKTFHFEGRFAGVLYVVRARPA